MAYMRMLPDRRCECGKAATSEVFGSRNEQYGEKCTPCAERLVRQLQVEEQARARGLLRTVR